MDKNKDINEKNEKEAVRFLERDFNQCFQQMRHYDSQIFDILKFMFTAYSVLIGIAIGVYQFGLKENHDLSLAAIAAIITGLILGIFMFALTIRNRVYFVLVTRYINEHREFFLNHYPLGFKNKTKMYTNYTQPPYFNWRSSQSWLCYISAALNSVLLMVLLYILFPREWGLILGFSGIFYLLQIAIAINYLTTRENKSASQAVFGKE